MSKEDYVKILVQTPARVIIALVFAFGGGAGYVHFLGIGDGSEYAEQELQTCMGAYANALSRNYQYETDISELSRWAKRAVHSLPELQRVEALNSAPKAYSSAQGVGLSH